MRMRWRVAGLPVALAMLLCAVASPAARAQGVPAQLSGIETEVQALRGRLDRLRSQYLQPEQAIRDYSFTNALLDARYYQSIDSHDAAVSLLLPRIEDPDNRAAPGWADGVYMLAESLFIQRDLLMARRYYVLLADNPQYGLDAARRRLEIALAMGRYDELEDLYRDLARRAGGTADDQIGYVRGKALYFQGLYADAIGVLGNVPQSSPLFDRARYLIGVSHTRMAQYDRAHTEFAGILTRLGARVPGEDPIVADLRNLTLLAEGRVFYEQRDWLAAIDAYIEVPRQSQRYPAALYEIAWTEIRQAAETDDRDLRNFYLETALNNLEILAVVSSADSRFEVQARLLSGDLLLQMERYGEAVQQFEAVASEYHPVEVELRNLRARSNDPDAFFDAIVNPEAGSLRLPIAAQPWFESDPQLDRALLAIADVETLRQEIDESTQLILELDAALNSGGRIDAFPRLREGWGMATEIQLDSVDVLAALVDAKASYVVPGLSPSDVTAYQALHRRRTELQAAVQAQPRTFAQISERERAVVSELNELLLEVHRTDLVIEAGREDLEALREMYIAAAGSTPSPDMLAVRAQLDAEARRLSELEAVAQAMRRELNVRQVQVGVRDDVSESERAVREQFRAAIAAEETFLHDRRDSAPNRDAAFDAIRRLLGLTVAISDDCEAFYTEVDRLVAEQTADMRDLLENERANVERYEERVAALDGETRAAAGQVAFAAFEDVYQRFSDLTLRANLGIIDVAWQQKEVLTEAIERLFDERNESLRELDADFAELLEGE